MIRKKLIYVWAAVAVLSLSACNDFLDRYPLEELSDKGFWKTPADAEIYVGDLYRRALPGHAIDADINSDNAVHGVKWAAGNISLGIYDPADFSWNSISSDKSKNDGVYGTIRACNLLLAKIDDIPNYDPAAKAVTIAEARFLRGIVYFSLIRAYGDVPYLDTPLELSQVKNIQRTPAAEIYTKIMADFDAAISSLPLKSALPANKYGRATKGAVQAIKARAALYYHQFETAADAANAVITSGEYELFDKDHTGRYAELFWESQEACSEAVLVRQYKYPTITHYTIGWECFPTKGWGGINPTQSLVDAFECTDGAPIGSSPLYKEKDPFANRDPRLEVNVLHDGETMYGVTIRVAPLKSSGNTGIAQHNDATATGYYHQKFLDPNIDPQSGGWNMSRDWHVVRFAELLLTYAEAKNEIAGLDATAFEAVNRVRRRVGLPDLQNADPAKPAYCATQDDLRQRIRNEWRVEFAQESGFRQWDIRRWGIAKTVLNAPFLGLKYTLAGTGDSQTCTLYEGENIKLTGSKYEDHNVIYPIPQEEMDLHKDWQQNPKY
jgi:hypothetical protein